jgi:hypothetical protein
MGESEKLSSIAFRILLLAEWSAISLPMLARNPVVRCNVWSFACAHHEIIFIDELDSLCRTRSASEDDTTRRIKTEIMKQVKLMLHHLLTSQDGWYHCHGAASKQQIVHNGRNELPLGGRFCHIATFSEADRR